MKPKFTTIHFPVFCNYTVHIELAEDIHTAMRKYPTTRNISTEDVEAITVHKDDASFSFVFFKPNANAGTIAHESYHIVRRILKYMGCDVDNEVVAYHLGYLVNAITNFIRKGQRR